jgi:hypothetical protein
MNAESDRKVLGFAALVLGYAAAAGSDLGAILFARVTVTYIFGAVMALWLGGEPIGTLRKITMRPICILFGTLMMIYAFTMMLFLREAGFLRKRTHDPVREYRYSNASLPDQHFPIPTML